MSLITIVLVLIVVGVLLWTHQHLHPDGPQDQEHPQHCRRRGRRHLVVAGIRTHGTAQPGQGGIACTSPLCEHPTRDAAGAAPARRAAGDDRARARARLPARRAGRGRRARRRRATPDDGGDARPARAPLVLDRQRRFARPGPAHGRGARSPAAAPRSAWRSPTSVRRVAPGSALDRHARTNTTSVYTPPRIFPMLPDRLSTDLTSLNPDEDRLAVVVGDRRSARTACAASRSVYRALVRNHAKLAYHAVGAWLRGRRSDAACGARRGSRAGGEPEAPGRRGAAAEGAPPRARRARARDHRGAGASSTATR